MSSARVISSNIFPFVLCYLSPEEISQTAHSSKYYQGASRHALELLAKKIIRLDPRMKIFASRRELFSAVKYFNWEKGKKDRVFCIITSKNKEDVILDVPRTAKMAHLKFLISVSESIPFDQQIIARRGKNLSDHEGLPRLKTPPLLITKDGTHELGRNLELEIKEQKEKSTPQ